MIDKEFRKHINNYALENDAEIYLFENPAFDNSICGITADNHLIYNYEDMIRELADDDNIDLLDAEEFIQYNTLRALPYMPVDGRPIILQYNRDHIKEFY